MEKYLHCFYALIFIVFSSVIVFAEQGDDSVKIKDKINSIRDKLQLDGLIVDSVLNQASELVDVKDPSKLEKVSSQNQAGIVKLLRKSNIFDYEIRCIVLEGNSADEIDVENNADLKNVISNPSFNRMGFSLKKEGSKTEVRLLLTRHVIQFALNFDEKVEFFTKKVTCIMSGVSNVDSLYYQSTQLDELPDSFVPSSMTNIKFEDSDYYRQEYESMKPFEKKFTDDVRPLFKEKMQNDELNYFEIYLPEPTGNIIFMDSKGKILAFVHH
jgi:hypothetical protein